jgi:hypothetical protein
MKNKKIVKQTIKKLYQEFKWAHHNKPEVRGNNDIVIVLGIFDGYDFQFSFNKKTFEFAVTNGPPDDPEVTTFMAGEAPIRELNYLLHTMWHGIYVREFHFMLEQGQEEPVIMNDKVSA